MTGLGSSASRTSTSPDSQCLPTTWQRSVASRRASTRASNSVPYRETSRLSPMPPLTATWTTTSRLTETTW